MQPLNASRAQNRAPASLRSIEPVDPSHAGTPSILTLREASSALRLSSRTLHRLCEIGEGPPRVQLSARRFGFFVDDINAWANARRTSKQAL